MNPMFESAALTYSTYACICWAVALVLALVLSHSPWALRILGAYAVAGAMIAASTGFLAVQAVAEDRIKQAVQLAANLERSEELLRVIESQTPPPVIHTIDGDTIEIDETILAVFRQHESKHDANR